MDDIFIGASDKGERQVLRLSWANRHGLVAGATGTGKTVTLQTIAEQFSQAGVPVFLADVKGDLSGFEHVGMPEIMAARHADARKIAFHIGQEYRNAVGRELFGHRLEGNRLARAGRTRDQTVAVGPAEQQRLAFACLGRAQENFGHWHAPSSVGARSIERGAVSGEGFCMAFDLGLGAA